MHYALCLVAVLGGCAQGDPTPISGQADAVRIIWTAYQQTKAPPPIYWRRDSCSEPNGIYGVTPWCTFIADGERVAGLESGANGYYVEVGAPSPGFTFSDTALAHELLHAALGGDYDHTSPMWGYAVADAAAALKASGL